ncbi:MAG: DUF1294 domain-containing protein [Bacillota bacterium]|uniref:Uncharacterized membrane protein YsdA (DUF1294 family) n=1 Tax=Fictibacillus halophilus TaxID=1610490 RepID=A0ABV2LHJ9_9BACL|nr:DUF1294 domain-containing protein [Fictibacillus phosphorivorans]
MLIIYLIILNVAAYYVMKRDKLSAKKGEWRTPEARLWLIAVIGGAPGMWLAMKKLRHKTKHPSFRYGLPLLSMFITVLAGWFI